MPTRLLSALFQLVLAVWILASWASPGHAQSADSRVRVRLSYAAPEGCPTAVAFRDRVAARLGYFPFDDSAESAIDLEITESDGTYSARLALRGATRGRRRIGPSRSCSSLVNTAVVTVTIMVDPLAVARAPAAPEADEGASEEPAPAASAPAPEPTEPAAAPPASTEASIQPSTQAAPAPPPPAPAAIAPARVSSSAPDEPARSRVEPLVGIELGGALGYAPAPSLLAALQVGLSVDSVVRVEVGARMRHTLVEQSVAAASVRLASWAGSLAACGQLGFVILCADFELGAYAAESSAFDVIGSALHVAAGGRAGVEARLAPGVGLRAMLGCWAPLTRVHLRLDGQTAWGTSPVAGELSAGVVFFPGSW